MKKIGIAILVTLASLSSHAFETACFNEVISGKTVVCKIKMSETEVEINWNIHGTPEKDYLQNGSINNGTFQKNRTTQVISGVAYFSGSDDASDSFIAISKNGVLIQPLSQNGKPIDPNMKPSPRVPCK